MTTYLITKEKPFHFPVYYFDREGEKQHLTTANSIMDALQCAHQDAGRKPFLVDLDGSLS